MILTTCWIYYVDKSCENAICRIVGIFIHLGTFFA